MTLLRAALFNLVFYVMTAAMGVMMLPLLATPARVTRRVGGAWSRMALWLARHIVGLDVEVRGLERIPEGPVIFAAKHQSAWDTLFFPAWFPDAAMVAKNELRWIPFYGWYAWRAGTVWIHRSAHGRALRLLIRCALDVLGAGRSIVIFPQGTRVAPGAPHVYLPGVAALYAGTGAPVVPVALNSGLFWGKRAFTKRPGTIVVEFLEPVAHGFGRDDFLEALSGAIEDATARLEAEGRAPAAGASG